MEPGSGGHHPTRWRRRDWAASEAPREIVALDGSTVADGRRVCFMRPRAGLKPIKDEGILRVMSNSKKRVINKALTLPRVYLCVCVCARARAQASPA